MFCEVFQFLPMFTVVNEAVLVVHGGLFHSADVTLAEFSKIQRYVVSTTVSS
jgi:hypothetical protein